MSRGGRPRKLSDAQAVAVYEAATALGRESYPHIGAKFNISSSLVGMIVCGQRYEDVTRDKRKKKANA